MAEILPHSSIIRRQVDTYLTHAAELTQVSSDSLRTSGEFTAVYKTALAADAVLSKLSGNERPKLSAARTVVRRVPLLLTFGQIEAASVELRRLIELSFWCIYFTDHPVEWRSFLKSPGKGIEVERTEPIAFCAHREPSYYANYAKERFRDEPSGIAGEAAGLLTMHYGTLSGVVHAGSLTLKGGVVPPIVPPSTSDLSSFMKTFRQVAGAVCLIVGAFRQRKFDSLPPMHRAWFDWLIGGSMRKRVRSQSFGLPDS
jgi:hypothetical protein